MSIKKWLNILSTSTLWNIVTLKKIKLDSFPQIMIYSSEKVRLQNTVYNVIPSESSMASWGKFASSGGERERGRGLCVVVRTLKKDWNILSC